MSRIALQENDDVEKQAYAEMNKTEAFCQFNHKTVDDENTDRKKE